MRLYGTKECEPCQTVKDFIKKHDLPVELIDVAKMSDSEYKNMKVLEIPLLVDGYIRIRGDVGCIDYLKKKFNLKT